MLDRLSPHPRLVRTVCSWRRHVVMCALVAAGTMYAPPSWSQEKQQAPSHSASGHDELASAGGLRVTLQYAIQRAVRHGPELGPAQASLRGVTEAQRRSRALLTTPPRLELALGPRIGGERGLDASAGLWQDFPLSGVGAARRRVANARRLAADLEIEDAKTSAALASGLAWVEARLAREFVKLHSRRLSEAERLEQVTVTRRDAGDATAGQVASARAIVGAARAAIVDAEGQRFAADAALSYALGLGPERRIEAVGSLERDGPTASEASALSAVQSHPRLRRLTADARTLTEVSEMTRAEGVPALAVGPSVTREATGDWIVLGRLSVPLPVVNSNAFEVAEQRRTALVARAQVRRERARLQSQARVLFHELGHARRVRDALKRDALAPAQAALKEALLRYQAGKTDLSEVLTARSALLEVEERRLMAAANAQIAELRLRAVTGKILQGGSQ
ncbi:MAG TPA: TolC family protein [Polyangiaceae bacterium]|nr:TolC family protein [Polyangiaceae bacterium]